MSASRTRVVAGGGRAQPRSRSLEFHPLTPDRWPDLVRLFGPRGACAGCWCMWPRRRGREFGEGQKGGNRRAFQRIVERGDPPGILAYQDGEPIGWCGFAPRESYARLAHSKVMGPVDDQPVWSVTCFFVARGARGEGLTVRLLGEAIRYARARGARILEGYPIDPKDGKTADTFVWTGLAAAFREAGFAEVARRAPTRPIMRIAIRGATASRPAARRAPSRPARVRRG